MTDELIRRISQDLRPVRHGAVLGRLLLSLTFGGLVSFLGVAVYLGLRPDLLEALRSAMFWVKLAYTLALAVIGVWCVERVSRPGGRPGRRMAWLLAPIAAILIAAAAQLARSAPDARPNLVMGASAAVCPGLILLTALPVLLSLMWAMRRLAPTRLRTAGAIAGLTAGGVGASIYALHCPESGAAFIALWYSSGVLLAGAVGAGLGARLLRW